MNMTQVFDPPPRALFVFPSYLFLQTYANFLGKSLCHPPLARRPLIKRFNFLLFFQFCATFLHPPVSFLLRRFPQILVPPCLYRTGYSFPNPVITPWAPLPVWLSYIPLPETPLFLLSFFFYLTWVTPLGADCFHVARTFLRRYYPLFHLSPPSRSLSNNPFVYRAQRLAVSPSKFRPEPDSSSVFLSCYPVSGLFV